MPPYHKDLVNRNNIYKLYYIYQYLYSKLNIDRNNLQIIFMENIGDRFYYHFLIYLLIIC
jgi:hypothetical protein